jgi:hypothetical protein
MTAILAHDLARGQQDLVHRVRQRIELLAQHRIGLVIGGDCDIPMFGFRGSEMLVVFFRVPGEKILPAFRHSAISSSSMIASLK